MYVSIFDVYGLECCRYVKAGSWTPEASPEHPQYEDLFISYTHFVHVLHSPFLKGTVSRELIGKKLFHWIDPDE